MCQVSRDQSFCSGSEQQVVFSKQNNPLARKQRVCNSKWVLVNRCSARHPMLEALILGGILGRSYFFHCLVNSRCFCFQFIESNRRLLSFFSSSSILFLLRPPGRARRANPPGTAEIFFRFLPCSASCLVGICRERRTVGAAQSPILDGFFERDMYLADQCFGLWLR